MNWQLGMASAVIQELYQTGVMRRELSWKTKLSIQLIYLSALHYGCEPLVVTKKKGHGHGLKLDPQECDWAQPYKVNVQHPNVGPV